MWNKKARPTVGTLADEKRSHAAMLGKVFAGFVGARVAETSGKSGLLGAATGLVISRVARRSPMGALVIGGAWLGHKLYKRGQERAFEKAARNAKRVGPAPAQPAEPAPPPASAQSVPVTPPTTGSGQGRN